MLSIQVLQSTLPNSIFFIEQFFIGEAKQHLQFCFLLFHPKNVFEGGTRQSDKTGLGCKIC